MKQRFILALAFVLLAATLFSFDGKRKGFILGFGIGISSLSYKQTLEGGGESITSPTVDETPFVTDFKIGYAPDNKLEIYYSSKVAWFSMTNIYDANVNIADGIGTFSASYFLSSKLKTTQWAPSPFVSAGFGFSAWSTPNVDNSTSWTGTGFFVGGGYEFAKHFRAELNFFMNNPSHTESGITGTTNSSALMLTINALAF